MWGDLGGILGASWGDLGGILGGSWGHLRGILASAWLFLGLGPSWGPKIVLEATGHVGGSWGQLGACQGHVGPSLVFCSGTEEGMMPGGPLQDPSSAFRSSIFIHFYDNPL